MEKWDLHCHTAEVSACANIPAEQLVELYVRHGYDGVVITDHLNGATFRNHRKTGWKERLDFYLSGYERTKQAAKGRLKVLLGMELSCKENNNDYLIFGITEGFLRKYNTETGSLRDMRISQISELLHENGMLLFQAHPFRNGMSVVSPSYLDGIESYNGNPRHASRNDIAQLWAKKYNLLETSGSDFHEIEDAARGGILTPVCIENQGDLIRALRQRPERIMTLDGFHKV